MGRARARLVTVAVAIAIAACTPTSNVGRSPSTSTPSTSGELPSPTGSAAPTAEPAPTAPSGWQPAAPMVYPRIDFRSVLLTDGTLLAVGDDGCGLLGGAVEGSERAQMYDPAADRWTEVGSLNKPRGVLQLVALPEGSAMVLGGVNEQDEEFSSTKVYSPTDRTWSPGPLMIRAGVYAAGSLADGTVISVGRGATEILDAGATAWRRSRRPIPERCASGSRTRTPSGFSPSACRSSPRRPTPGQRCLRRRTAIRSAAVRTASNPGKRIKKSVWSGVRRSSRRRPRSPRSSSA